MHTCPGCGKTVAEGASFCPNCGNKIAAPSAAPAPKFCPKCGEALRGGEFCPNCGADLRAKSAAPKLEQKSSGGKGKLAGIAVALVAVVLVIAAGVKFLPGMLPAKPDGGDVSRGPSGSVSEEKAPEEAHKQFIAYQEKLILEPLMASLEKADQMVPQRFVSDLTVTASVNNDMIQRYLTNSSVGLKLDLSQDKLLADSELVLMGSPVLSGAVTYDKGKLGFCLPQVDETYYVMDLSQVVRSMSGQQVNFSALSMPDLSLKEWAALARTYLDIVNTVVTEDSVTAEEDMVDLSKLGASFKGTVYTFTPRAKDVKNMLEKLADHMEKDKTLRSLILKVSGAEMLVAVAGVEIFDGADMERELDNALIETARELRNNAASIAGAFENGSFTWTLAMEDRQVRMVRLRDKDADMSMVLELQGTADAGMECAAYCKDGGDELFLFTGASRKTGTDTWEYDFQLQAEKKIILKNECTRTGSVYNGTITGQDPYDSSASFSVTYNADASRKSPLGLPYGSYDFQYRDYYQNAQASLKVSGAANGGADHTITIQGLSGETDGMFDRLDLNINAVGQTTARMPSGPSRDISGYTPEQFEELFTRLGDTLQQDLIYNLMPLIYGYGA